MPRASRCATAASTASSGRRAATSTAGIGPVDLVIVLVKSYHTREAIESARGIVGPDTVVMSLQNGLGHEEILADVVGRGHVMAGKTYAGGVMLAPGHVIAGTQGQAHDHRRARRLGHPARDADRRDADPRRPRDDGQRQHRGHDVGQAADQRRDRRAVGHHAPALRRPLRRARGQGDARWRRSARRSPSPGRWASRSPTRTRRTPGTSPRRGCRPNSRRRSCRASRKACRPRSTTSTARSCAAASAPACPTPVNRTLVACVKGIERWLSDYAPKAAAKA